MDECDGHAVRLLIHLVHSGDPTSTPVDGAWVGLAWFQGDAGSCGDHDEGLGGRSTVVTVAGTPSPMVRSGSVRPPKSDGLLLGD